MGHLNAAEFIVSSGHFYHQYGGGLLNVS